MDSTQQISGLVPTIGAFPDNLPPKTKLYLQDDLSANDDDIKEPANANANSLQIKFEKHASTNNNNKANNNKLNNLINIKPENINTTNSPQLNLNYNDLIVALWNMVENETTNSNNQPLTPIIGRLGDTNHTLIINNNNTSLHNSNNSNTSNHNNHFSDDSNKSRSSSSKSPTNSLLSSPILTPSSCRKRLKAQQTAHFSVLEYCPNYESYDSRARKESKERISSHLRERQKLVKKCIESVTQEIDSLGLSYGPQHKHIKFEDNNEILSNALLHLKQQIDKWDGVQIKQCKKEQEDGTKIIIDTWQKFAKKAKNHQDQTSWKISGDYFFAPYIGKVKKYITKYCTDINTSHENMLEIIKLGCISFAMQLLNGKIKFHRTKLKPLIRHRTLVKSNGIHLELENLFSSLTVRKFIQNAKAKRKENDGKSNIIAGDFYKKLVVFIETQYQSQKKLVYNLIHNKNKYKYKYESVHVEDINDIAMSLVTPHIPLTPIPLLPIIPNIPCIPCIPSIPTIPFTMNSDFTIKLKKRKRKIHNYNDTNCNPNKKMKFDMLKYTFDANGLEYKTDFEYVLSSCNGSCGNKFGTFVAGIIEGNIYYLSAQEKLDVIAHKFGEYGNMMRDYFISLINDDNYDDLCVNLQNENVYISHILSKDSEWISIFITSFKSLLMNKCYILQKLVDKSCKRCNLELLEEIERNNVLMNMNMNMRLDFFKYHEKIERVKETNEYKMMKLQGKGLSNNEIIAIYIFISNENICNEFIKYGNTCKWKQLYHNLCCAINKMYKIFVYKNNKNNDKFVKQLYHASYGETNYVNTNSWIFHTIHILYKNMDDSLKNIMNFKNKDINNENGCLLRLVGVQNDLYNGQLIAAPIDWIISQNNNNNNNNNCDKDNISQNQQWISLPTIFKNVKFEYRKENISYWKLTVNQYVNKNQDTLSISSESQTTESSII